MDKLALNDPDKLPSRETGHSRLLQVSYIYTKSAMLAQVIGFARENAKAQRLLLQGTYRMPLPNDVSGAAALAICESLLLALNDNGVLPEHEIVGILKDAATANQDVPGNEENTILHAAVAKLINSIIDGGNSVRRP